MTLSATLDAGRRARTLVLVTCWLINAAQLSAVIHTFAITKQRALAQPDSLGFSDTAPIWKSGGFEVQRCTSREWHNIQQIWYQAAIYNVKMACLPSNPGCRPDTCSNESRCLTAVRTLVQ